MKKRQSTNYITLRHLKNHIAISVLARHLWLASFASLKPELQSVFRVSGRPLNSLSQSQVLYEVVYTSAPIRTMTTGQLRQQYHFRESENGLLAWDVFKLIKLVENLPVYDHPLESIQEVDEEYWYSLGDNKPTCRNIAEHAALIQQADLLYPVILDYQGRVMDGMHRICKAVQQDLPTIKAKRLIYYVEPDFINVAPDELSY